MEKTRTTALILLLFKAIPLPLRRIFFVGLCRLFYLVVPRQRMITLHNLQRAYPEKSLEEITAIAKGAYRHLGFMAADFFEIPWIDRGNLHRWVECEGLEHYEAAISQGKGILSIVAHFGNWELMTAVIPLVAQPMNIVYRPLDNPVLENLFAWVRSCHGNDLLPKEGAGMKILRLLRRNQTLGILIDQNAAVREGIFVDFFGRPACTASGLAILAMRSGAPVIPAFLPRQADGRYKLILLPPVSLDHTGDFEQDLVTNTQRFTRVIEDMVRQYPDQWFWLHQRWKTKTCQRQ